MLKVSDNHIVLGGGGGGGGDVVGAASSTDNAIARFDGITGKLLQNSSNVVITDSGFLGIGTSAPVSQLHVEGVTAGISLHRVGGEPFIRLSSPLDLVGIGGQLRGISTGKGLRFTNPLSDVEWMRIDDVGNVSIGTATATAKLDVNGTFRSRGGATFNGQIIDNAGSAGTDGQVLKKVGGLVVWANP